MKVPAGTVTLPSNIRADVWQSWPRKSDAHVLWAVRARQIDALIGRKKIRMFLCPDVTLRIPTEDLVAHFGAQPSGELADVAAAKVPKQIDPIELDDPVALMFRESVAMLRASAQQTQDVLRMLLDPMNAALGAMRDAMGQLKEGNVVLGARVKDLELARDQTLREREELIDNRHMRDLVMSSEMAREQRRNRIVESFTAQLPTFIAKWTGGTLADFIGNYSPDEWELLFNTGFVKPEQQAQIRDLLARAAAAKKAQADRAAREAERSAANGAASTPVAGGN